jgi:hypothetical protein
VKPQGRRPGSSRRWATGTSSTTREASRIDLAWHGSNHSPDNIFIHLPDHDTLMLVGIVNPGWAPVYQSSLTEDVQGYIKAPDTALSYSWKHFIGGHMGRLGTREDIALHQQYMADIAENSRKALDTVDPTPYFIKARSLAHPLSMTDPYKLWYWIDIRDRECATGA